MMGSSIFLSTPSARRATTAWMEQNDTEIFLSTPSARRATQPFRPNLTEKVISIHALCEEGDFGVRLMCAAFRYFYPRPLRGGRPGFGWFCRRGFAISIHALCEEGDSLQFFFD